MADLTCVLDARDTLGEGPVWSPPEQALYWVDIKAPAIRRLVPATGAVTTWPMPSDVGSLALRSTGGGAIAALRDGFHLVDFGTGAVTPVHDPEPGMDGNRFNDGKCDRAGRFWAGTMLYAVEGLDEDGAGPAASAAAPVPAGALYRYDPDGSCHRMVDGVTCSNGLGWSPDGRTMYYTDSRTYSIVAYDFDPASGAIAHKRLFAVDRPEDGLPDGLTVDAEGYVWSAKWDGWRIVRYAPDGTVDRVVELPVARVTSCAFGGPDLDVLYVTSARGGLTAAALADQPLAGGLFAVRPGVGGLPEPTFAG